MVDDALRSLSLPELPMTLLRKDRESKRELLQRLDQIDKRRPTDEVNAHYESLSNTLEKESAAAIRRRPALRGRHLRRVGHGAGRPRGRAR